MEEKERPDQPMRELMLSMVSVRGRALRHGAEAHKADREIVMTAVSRDGSSTVISSPICPNLRMNFLLYVMQCFT